MTNKKLSELTDITRLEDVDQLYAIQSGQSKKLSALAASRYMTKTLWSSSAFTVGAAGCDFTTVKAACDHILTLPHTAEYFILVDSGEFVEQPFTVPCNTWIIGSNQVSKTKIRVAGTSGDLVTLETPPDGDSWPIYEFKNLELVNHSKDATGAVCMLKFPTQYADTCYCDFYGCDFYFNFNSGNYAHVGAEFGAGNLSFYDRCWFTCSMNHRNTTQAYLFHGIAGGGIWLERGSGGYVAMEDALSVITGIETASDIVFNPGSYIFNASKTGAGIKLVNGIAPGKIYMYDPDWSNLELNQITGTVDIGGAYSRRSVNGVATIPNGATYIDVTHGFNAKRGTLTAQMIQVTPTNNMGNAAKFWVSNVGATTFRINVNADPGASTATFSWQVQP